MSIVQVKASVPRLLIFRVQVQLKYLAVFNHHDAGAPTTPQPHKKCALRSWNDTKFMTKILFKFFSLFGKIFSNGTQNNEHHQPIINLHSWRLDFFHDIPFRKTFGDKATPLNLFKTEITDQKWNHISINPRKLTEPCTLFFQRELKLSMAPNF